MSSYEIVGLTEADMARCVEALLGSDSKAQVRRAVSDAAKCGCDIPVPDMDEKHCSNCGSPL